MLRWIIHVGSEINEIVGRHEAGKGMSRDVRKLVKVKWWFVCSDCPRICKNCPVFLLQREKNRRRQSFPIIRGCCHPSSQISARQCTLRYNEAITLVI